MIALALQSSAAPDPQCRFVHTGASGYANHLRAALTWTTHHTVHSKASAGLIAFAIQPELSARLPDDTKRCAQPQEQF